MKNKLRLISLLLFLSLLTGCINFSHPSPLLKAKAGSSGAVPILVYHSVTDKMFSKNKALFTKPKEFEKQIKWIKNNGYTPIFADQLQDPARIHKPVVITFDDGYEDNYNTVFNIIKKYHVKITIFVATRFIDKQYYLTSREIGEMDRSGLVSIQSHTVSHHHLSQLSPSQLKYELEQSRDALFKITGKYPTIIAYPYGDYNEAIISEAKKFYSLGFSTSKGGFSNGPDKFTIKRYGVGRFTTLKNIKQYIK
ncbi:MAG: putative xylanase/chitin deacetylase [Eubacterium sp.]|nr:putative xylanase/chitin deacetylase [Eubacterium sp.]